MLVVDGIEVDSKDVLSKMAKSCGYCYAEVKLEESCWPSGGVALVCRFYYVKDDEAQQNKEHSKLYDGVLAGKWFMLEVQEDKSMSYEDAFLKKMVELSRLDGFEGFYVESSNDNNKHEILSPNETFEQALIRFDLYSS